MGKVRIKTLGDETAEKKQKEEAKKRAEAKRAVKQPEDTTAEEAKPIGTKEPAAQPKAKKEKFVQKKLHKHSNKYQAASAKVDRKKVYKLDEALQLLPQLTVAKFDETVEMHINTIEKGISGSVTLPHGTGKKMRVAIADESVIAEVEKGKIDFDILLAQPQMMPKLAKVARILGPRGLMPNPKNGTITQNPQEAAKKYEAGQMNFKTEAKYPLLHLTVGKVSFGEKKLAENIKSAIDAIQSKNIIDITLKSTMSPGIKVNFSSV